MFLLPIGKRTQAQTNQNYSRKKNYQMFFKHLSQTVGESQEFNKTFIGRRTAMHRLQESDEFYCLGDLMMSVYSDFAKRKLLRNQKSLYFGL